MKRVAIISPSGKYYGSEQVLHDFLMTTTEDYYLFLPKGKFYDILSNENRHNRGIIGFWHVRFLYFRIWLLLISNSIDTVYVNEGGHSRYIRLLARLFPSKRFVIHVRLLEDCRAERIGQMPPNVKLISVSDYITREIQTKTGQKAVTIHDVYQSSNHAPSTFRINQKEQLQIGVVGRVTDTKGIDELADFCRYADENYTMPLTINFFGDIDEKSDKVRNFVTFATATKNIRCVFHGYVAGVENIYPKMDILLHFNKVEPLGRIAFEALDYGVPFVGFNAGGIGEIARLTGLSELMVSADEANPASCFMNRIKHIVETPDTFEYYKKARALMVKKFAPEVYAREVENLILGRMEEK